MSAHSYEGFIDVISDGMIAGWVRRLDTDEPVTVNIFAGDSIVIWGVAADFRPDLLEAKKGNGNHGFALRLPARIDISGLRVGVSGSEDFSLPLPPSVPKAPSAALTKRDQPALQSGRQGRLLIDLTDIVFHIRDFESLSGIQRVQYELLRHIALFYQPNEIVYCVTMPSRPHYVEMPLSHVTALVRDAGNLSTLSTAQRNFFRDTGWIDTAEPLEAGPGDIFINPGNFWGFPGIPERLTELKKKGVSIVVLIYDLLPIYDSEYFVPEHAKLFYSAFDYLTHITDRFLTISNYTAAGVTQFYRDSGRDPISIEAVQLAHQSVAMIPKQPKGQLSGTVAAAVERPFVLSVGTIEVRKNHGYLFRIWRELLAKHGPDNVPRLILVGRKGWMVDDFFQQLTHTNFLNRHILLLNDLSDDELAQLYHHCLFTMFPSFGEGWGLPVGESLAYGKACIASNAGSIPEVGGDYVLYCDPHYPRDGFDKVESLLFEPGKLAGMEEKIKTSPLRGWREVAERFFRNADIRSPAGSSEAPSLRQEFPIPFIPYGRLASVARNDVEPVAGHASPPLGMIFVEGWNEWTHNVVWSNGRVALLRFAVLAPEDSDTTLPLSHYRLYFLLSLPPEHPPCRVTILENRANKQDGDCTPSKNSLITLIATGNQRGPLRVFEIEVQAGIDVQGSHGIGIRALAVTRMEDIEGRLTVMEDLLTHRNN